MFHKTTFTNNHQDPDAQVIDEILQGNTALFEMLIRRYNAFLYKSGRAYGYNHQDTEDLMQETFINAYQALSKFQNRSSFKTWIIKIMLHECYHKSKKHSYQKEKPSGIPDNSRSQFMFLNNNHSDPGKLVANKELSHVIEASLNKLPQEYRMTFALRELAGLSVSETAALMDVTPSNVKVRLNRAKVMLRKEIENVYSPEDIYEFNLIYCNNIVDAVMNRVSS